MPNLYTDPSFPRPRGRAPRGPLPMTGDLKLSDIQPQPAEGRAGQSLQSVQAQSTELATRTIQMPLNLTLHHSINKWSLAGGLASSAAALLLLLDEPVEALLQRGQNTFALDHFLTVSLLTVTTILGHLTVKSFQARRIGGSLAFPVLFAFGTCLTIYNSATRQSLVDERTQLEATVSNDSRAELEAELKKMRLLRDETARAAGRACQGKSEPSDNCKGKKATRDFYQRALSEAELKLSSAPAPKLETTKAQQFAKLLKDLGISIPATLVAAILPFALALFFELTSIACYVNVRKETFK